MPLDVTTSLKKIAIMSVTAYEKQIQSWNESLPLWHVLLFYIRSNQYILPWCQMKKHGCVKNSDLALIKLLY